MKHLARFNVGIIIALLVASYLVYSLLLQDNFLHASIASIISHSHQLNNRPRLCILALLPIYIGTVVFGAAMLGIYLGSLVQKRILKKERKKLLSAQHTR